MKIMIITSSQAAKQLGSQATRQPSSQAARQLVCLACPHVGANVCLSLRAFM